MIELKNIKKSYGNRVVLDDVTLSFKDQTISVIKGVSGCGKTTLLNLISGLLEDYEGEYLIDGKSAREEINARYRDKIGYIFQQSLLFRHMNVYENLKFILDDEDRILYYANLFEVEHLLEKNVEELSNGERQRISIIRALLLDPKILLCDEPSASLDPKQSEKLAETFGKLHDMGIIIIIATHEECFNDIADSIINIHYGKIQNETVNHKDVVVQKREEAVSEKKKAWKADLNFALHRNKRSGKVLNLILILIFLTLALSISVILHFSGEYKEYIYTQYPYHMISLKSKFIDSELRGIDYKVYENIRIQGKDNLFLPYYEYKDSAFRIPRAIEYGKFPESSNEIILSQDYVQDVMKTDLDKVVGKDITFDRKTYTISGVLTNEESVLNSIYDKNPYMQGLNQPVVFMEYEELYKHNVEIIKTEESMIAVDIEKGTEAYNHIKDVIGFPWMSNVNENVSVISFYTKLIMGCLLCLGVIVFLFLTNIIFLELYYRKKELGFLQIFSVSKKRIRRIVFLEYFSKIVLALIMSDIAYVIIGFVIKHMFGFMFWLSIGELLLLHLFVVVYMYALTLLPLSRILKKPIIELIKE